MQGNPGDAECTLTAASSGKSYLALMTSISSDRTSVQFTKLEDDDDDEDVSVRIYLYRKVEWIWEVKEPKALASTQVQTPAIACSISPSSRSEPPSVSGLTAKLAESRIGSYTDSPLKGPGKTPPLLWADDDWETIAPLFRSASNNVLGLRDKNITWQQYVRSVSVTKSSRLVCGF